jgi:hypothetical protein
MPTSDIARHLRAALKSLKEANRDLGDLFESDWQLRSGVTSDDAREVAAWQLRLLRETLDQIEAKLTDPPK